MIAPEQSQFVAGWGTLSLVNAGLAQTKDRSGLLWWAASLLLGPVATFLIVCVIYWAVPKGHMPWRSVWPGALFFALVTSIGNYIFPLYLTSISDLHRIGGTIGFILIALVWFYAISLALLAGAVINSLRHESDDTGALPLEG